MDDDFGDDRALAALTASIERSQPQQPLARANAPSTTAHTAQSSTKVVQPTPQALTTRSGPSQILVAVRQKGNPCLNFIKSTPWEYSDILADYVLGATTCALFLSLKYHRLHPEYIYSRIKALGHKYKLRLILILVDIQTHEESLRELSKTSLINDVTLILCWSAQEAGRYLELYKSFEHASATSIRAHQSTSYADKLTDFVTVPRSINKTDAVSLVSAFGSIRAAVNAQPEQIGDITGWGEIKVRRWCDTVRENFRMQKAAKRGLQADEIVARPIASASLSRSGTLNNVAATIDIDEECHDGREASPAAIDPRKDATVDSAYVEMAPSTRKPEEGLSASVAAALEKLRNGS